jgi:hypothetical protein
MTAQLNLHTDGNELTLLQTAACNEAAVSTSNLLKTPAHVSIARKELQRARDKVTTVDLELERSKLRLLELVEELKGAELAYDLQYNAKIFAKSEVCKWRSMLHENNKCEFDY